MNCLYETVAGMYLSLRYKIIQPVHDDVGDAEENLESCRASLAAKERELGLQCASLARAALVKRKSGDVSGARFSLQERRRNISRLEKVRASMSLVDKQLDALRNSELDKELMNSLRMSSQAMRKAGVGAGVEDAETVMNELDDQIREASELTTVLATPMMSGAGDDDDTIDVDAELGLITEQDTRVNWDALELPIAPQSREERALVVPAVSTRTRPVVDF